MKALVASLGILLATTATGLANAEGPSAAERSFREGRDAMLSGDYAGAERAFEASLLAEVSAAALLNLAVCEEYLGDLLGARAHVEQMLGLLDPSDERYPVGLLLKGSLDQRISTVEAPARAVTREQPKPVVSPPCKHAQQAGQSVRARNDTGKVVNSTPLPSYLLAVVGAAAIGVTVGTGIVALEKKDEALAACPSKRCTERGLRFAADARTYAAISTASLGAAVASLGIASWLFFRDRPHPANRSIAVEGSFSRDQSRLLVSGAF